MWGIAKNMLEDKYTFINTSPREVEQMKLAVKSKAQQKDKRKTLKRSRNKRNGKADVNGIFVKIIELINRTQT